jgi:hypothetical protein
MDSEPHDVHTDDPACDLSLHEAAALYTVSARTLAQHIRCGQLAAYKTAGATGREWRVTREALAAAYASRQQPAADGADHPLLAQLRRELDAARRAASAERRRAEDADRRLGHALLECGRLRSALAAATGAQTPATEVDLTAAEAREVVRAVREAATPRR